MSNRRINRLDEDEQLQSELESLFQQRPSTTRISSGVGSGTETPLLPQPVEPVYTQSYTGSRTSDASPVATAAVTNTRSVDYAGITDRSTAENAIGDLGDYNKSQAVLDAEAALAEWQAQKPGDYQSNYQSQIDELLNSIQNRQPFSYDYSTDPLFLNAREMYAQNAHQAAVEAGAEAAALTGGYGSSYSTMAAQQAANQQLGYANEILPDLYSMALQQYQAENTDMYNQLTALRGAESDAYGRYQDTVADYYNNLSALTTSANNAYSRDYGQYQNRLGALMDLRDYYAGQEQQAFNNDMTQKEYELAVQRYEEAQRQWAAEQAAEQARWEAQLAEEQRQFNAQLDAQMAEIRARYTGNNGNTGNTGPINPSAVVIPSKQNTSNTEAIQRQNAAILAAGWMASKRSNDQQIAYNLRRQGYSDTEIANALNALR